MLLQIIMSCLWHTESIHASYTYIYLQCYTISHLTNTVCEVLSDELLST